MGPTLTYPHPAATVSMMPKRLTKAAASEAARALGSLSARKAGLASAAALTEKQRQEKARKAIAARWGKVKRPKGQELPIDQQQVMARIAGADKVTLRIAPGSNGTRRLRAISRLEDKGVIHVVTLTGKDVTIARSPKAKQE